MPLISLQAYRHKSREIGRSCTMMVCAWASRWAPEAARSLRAEVQELHLRTSGKLGRHAWQGCLAASDEPKGVKHSSKMPIQTTN